MKQAGSGLSDGEEEEGEVSGGETSDLRARTSRGETNAGPSSQRSQRGEGLARFRPALSLRARGWTSSIAGSQRGALGQEKEAQLSLGHTGGTGRKRAGGGQRGKLLRLSKGASRSTETVRLSRPNQ